MGGIKLENISKIYQSKDKVKTKAVDNINLEIKDKEFIVLVGPSGCGKSTTLRMIARSGKKFSERQIFLLMINL